MCNLKLKEIIDKTDGEVQLQACVLEDKSVEKHKNVSCKHGHDPSSRRHTLDCPRSLDNEILISTEKYISNHFSENNSSTRRSLPDLGKICSKRGNLASLERRLDCSLELNGKAMKPFFHMWTRSQEVKVIGRGKLAPPKALARQGMFRECGCFTRDFLQSNTPH
ncbi:hypothetical protein ACJMK2_009505 [Sinanodonta woodiana]|uniref:Uncharacterized protein n=1 Tax=Sinanodonta woodiana TaxID=1069815 RepID=A0ABD3VCG0_SINWO